MFYGTIGVDSILIVSPGVERDPPAVTRLGVVAMMPYLFRMVATLSARSTVARCGLGHCPLQAAVRDLRWARGVRTACSQGRDDSCLRKADRRVCALTSSSTPSPSWWRPSGAPGCICPYVYVCSFVFVHNMFYNLYEVSEGLPLWRPSRRPLKSPSMGARRWCVLHSSAV